MFIEHSAILLFNILLFASSYSLQARRDAFGDRPSVSGAPAIRTISEPFQNTIKSRFYPPKHPLPFHIELQGMTRNYTPTVRNTLLLKELSILEARKKCVCAQSWPCRVPGAVWRAGPGDQVFLTRRAHFGDKQYDGFVAWAGVGLYLNPPMTANSANTGKTGRPGGTGPGEVRAPADGRRGVAALVEGMRIPHWIKNLFVAAPLLFSRHWQASPEWDSRLALCETVLAFVSFCLISSAIYLVNDVVDRDSDRLHPTKCRRPVASGRLSAHAAVLAAIALAVAGMGAAVAVGAIESRQTLMGQGTAVFAACFGLLNVLYVFVLKRHPIVDVIAISLGFVLRAMGGAVAIGVPSSPWLVLCTFTLCLFIALCKRRGELMDLGPQQAAATRVANSAYDLAMVEYMLTV